MSYCQSCADLLREKSAADARIRELERERDEARGVAKTIFKDKLAERETHEARVRELEQALRDMGRCDDCRGEGCVLTGAGTVVPCDECDGEGLHEPALSLLAKETTHG